MSQFSTINYRKLGTFDASLSLRSPSDSAVSATTPTAPIEFDAKTFNSFSVVLIHSDIANVVANSSEWTIAVQVASARNGSYTTVATKKLSGTGYRYQISLSGDEVFAVISAPRWVRLTATKIGTPGDLTFWAWITEAVGIGVPPSVLGAVASPSPTPSPSPPTPTVAISSSVPSAGIINAAITLAATASVIGDTLSGTQFKVNGTNQGAVQTGGFPSVSWTPTTKGAYSIAAVATGVQGGATTSAAKSIQVFDTKLDPNVSGGAGAGCSLGCASGDYILFDNNQGAGGVAQTMNISVSSAQVAAFNYTDTAYAGKLFAYFHSGILYTGTVQGVVNF